jgi:hypothetical protein
MAQWKGQYSGKTHATKVRDCEHTLRATISAAESSPTSFVGADAVNLLQIAQSVLDARYKRTKALLSNLREPSAKSFPTLQIAKMELLLQNLEAAGPIAIFREFKAPDHLIAGVQQVS